MRHSYALLFSLLSFAANAQAPSPAVQPIPLARPDPSALAGRKGTYTLTVPADASWFDTGVAVVPGDALDFSATGTLTLPDGRTAAPAGLARGWKDLLRNYPLNSANAGALIGRVGKDEAAVPFAIGGQLHTEPGAGGELYLAANFPEGFGATGSYQVTLKIGKASAEPSASASFDLSRVLSPALFDRIPRRVSDENGDAGDMVNFALLGTEAQVQKAFTAAGWVQVDKTTNAAVLHGLVATLSKQAYLEMPMSTLYLFGRAQDLSYARADPLMVAMVRHHLRLWNSGQTVGGVPLWVGSATHDNGLERDQRTQGAQPGGLTHHIDPHVDTERDFVEGSFASAGAVAAAAYLTPANPVTSARTATGGSWESDGRVVVMLLR